MKQKVRVELIVVALLIGGFIGVTFWCNCKSGKSEGMCGSVPATVSGSVPTAASGLVPDTATAENKKTGCGCNKSSSLFKF